MQLYIVVYSPNVTRKEILILRVFLFFKGHIICRNLCKIQMNMTHVILTLIAATLLSGASVDKAVTSEPVFVTEATPAQQNVFQVIAWYKNGYQTYKAKLKLKLVKSMYGQNSYMATEYATEQLQNGQWLWRSCSASCQYNAVNRQYSVFIGGTTFYFDDPLE